METEPGTSALVRRSSSSGAGSRGGRRVARASAHARVRTRARRPARMHMRKQAQMDCTTRTAHTACTHRRARRWFRASTPAIGTRRQSQKGLPSIAWASCVWRRQVVRQHLMKLTMSARMHGCVGTHARPCRHACTDVSCLVDVACVCVRACFCANVSACGRVCLKARNVLRGMPQHVPRSVQHARGMPRHVTRSTYASRCDLLARCRGRRRWTEHCDKRGINNDDCASASTSTVREPDSANRRTSR